MSPPLAPCPSQHQNKPIYLPVLRYCGLIDDPGCTELLVSDTFFPHQRACVQLTSVFSPPHSQGSSGDERAMAKELAGLLCDGTENTVAEGQEPAEFWDLLGGKTPYANDKRYRTTASPPLGSPCLQTCELHMISKQLSSSTKWTVLQTTAGNPRCPVPSL